MYKLLVNGHHLVPKLMTIAELRNTMKVGQVYTIKNNED